MTAAHLLAVRWRMTRHRWRGDPVGRGRSLLLAAVGLLFAVAVWAASRWFFSQCLVVEPIGMLVARRGLGMVLLVVFSLVVFSALVTAFSTLVLDADLELLMAAPLPPESLYIERFALTSLQASWMAVMFSLPILLAAGQTLGGGAGFYVSLVVVYLGMTTIPIGAGMTAALALTRVMPARRARRLMIAAGSLVVGLVFVLLRVLEPERLMHPDASAPIVQALAAVERLDPPWSPSAWALDALWQDLGPTTAAATGHPRALMLSAAAAVFFASGWAFRRLQPSAFSRAREGSSTDTALRPGRRRPRPPSSAAAALRSKGRLAFVRDTAQWSQLMVLAAIVALYVLNFTYIRAASGSGLVSELGLWVFNLALTGFVVLALAARFVFPAVSLEGQAFWIVRTSPVTMRSVLDATATGWAFPVTAFGAALAILTQLVLSPRPVLLVASGVCVLSLATGLTALAVGVGARFPRFDTHNAAAIATGLGAVAYMLTAAVTVAVTVLVSITPTVVALRLVEERPVRAWTAAVAVVCLAVEVALPLAAGRMALAIGARRLESET